MSCPSRAPLARKTEEDEREDARFCRAMLFFQKLAKIAALAIGVSSGLFKQPTPIGITKKKNTLLYKSLCSRHLSLAELSGKNYLFSVPFSSFNSLTFIRKWTRKLAFFLLFIHLSSFVFPCWCHNWDFITFASKTAVMICQTLWFPRGWRQNFTFNMAPTRGFWSTC